MKNARIVLTAVGVAVVAIGSYDFYLRHRVDVLYREVRARELLSIPAHIRVSLTDGTPEGTAKGAEWLEQRLGTKQGDVAALYILNSLGAEKLAPLPCYRSYGFCGNASRWERCRCQIRAMKQHLESVDQVIQRYLADQDKPSLRPLPKVDWMTLTDIESKALAAVETKNLGLLVIVSDGVGDARFIPFTHPSDPRRVKLHRVGQYYDVRSCAPVACIIEYELAGEPASSLHDRVTRLSFDPGDGDLDGLPGIASLEFDTRFTPIPRGLASQPYAPRWEDLVSLAKTSTPPE